MRETQIDTVTQTSEPKPQNSAEATEIFHKLTLIRDALRETEAGGIRLRGVDWFAWATAGGSNAVLLTSETGIAEVLVTAKDAWILTDEIGAQRLLDEELPVSAAEYKLQVYPWTDATEREAFVQQATEGKLILSDRPVAAEGTIPRSLRYYKRLLMPEELNRYRQIGKLASEAMTEVLRAAQPTWTEYQLAGAEAEAMWVRGLHPILTLVAGERRLPLYRHPIPTGEVIGQQAVLAVCVRGYGLCISLSRFVSFGTLSDKDREQHSHVRAIEAAALHLCQPGTSLDVVYQALQQAYEQHGYSQAIQEHYQGGTTGYLAHEVIATPHTTDLLTANMATAWNPSLPGAQIEDTFVISPSGTLENLTLDPEWESIEVEGRDRPLPLEH